MGFNDFKADYLCYLMNIAGIDAEGADGYLSLAERLLYSCPFIPIVDMDENRYGDIEEIRERWAESFDVDPDEMNDELGDGSFMELMVVLAEKIQYEMIDSVYEAGTGKWFKEIMTNCGMDRLTNEYFEDDPEGGDIELKGIVSKIVTRQYGWDGEGSFFPLVRPTTDMRAMETLIQMNYYIEENYDIC